MPSTKSLKIAAAVATSFTVLVIVIIALMVKQVIAFELAILMMVALVGLYVGFGILIVVYQLVKRLD